ncbi:MAG: hypothetical protein JSS55_02560 [Proteobacteria bacterium]|nr:hypothetical protein [Pseudomonadota bacterium]
MRIAIPAGLLAVGVIAPACAGPIGHEELTPARLLDLQNGYSMTLWSQGCLDETSDDGKRRVQKLFEKRLIKVEKWFSDQFGEQAIESARRQRGEFIVAGDCQMGRDRRGRNPTEISFKRRLLKVEQSIRRVEEQQRK